MHRVLVTMAIVVEGVLPHVGGSPDDFWGSHSGLIVRAIDEQRDMVVGLVRTLISAAQQRFNAKYAGVPRESLEPLMWESFWQANPLPNEWARVCPACGAQGVSQLRPEIRRLLVDPDLPRRTVAGYKAIDFRCPICKLALESEELVDAAVGFEAWEEESDNLDLWAEDFGIENLTPEDLRELPPLE